MITGTDIAIIYALCNSTLFQFYLSKIQNENKKNILKNMVLELQENYSKSKVAEIDSMIFDLYNISQDERNIIKVSIDFKEIIS